MSKFSRCLLGDYSYGKVHVIGKTGQVIVRKYCSIADGVTAVLVGHHPEWVTTYPFSDPSMVSTWPEARGIQGQPNFYGDIVIGNDVWIGQNAMLMGGITIGDGAIIAAGSVVTKNVEPYWIVGGTPARGIRLRHKTVHVKQLLEIKWWDWPIEKVKKFIPLLCGSKIEEFLTAAIDCKE